MTRALPSFYDAQHAAQWSYRPDVATLATAAQAYRRDHGIGAASNDKKNVQLLIIDAQRDFCHPQGTLFVAGADGNGAVSDTERLSRFIYGALDKITGISCTLDTHAIAQIFFPAFWLDADGNMPGAHRVVTSEDLVRGALRVNPSVARALNAEPTWLDAHALHYVRTLEQNGKYALYLWPFHCLLGSEGHALAGVLDEARTFHAMVRQSATHDVMKGYAPFTESYSVFKPEVLNAHDGAPLAPVEQALFERLAMADVVLVAGQASSHCVRSSVDDLIDHVAAISPERVRRIRVLTDCMSPVVVRDASGAVVADFSAAAESAFARWAERGVVLVESGDGM